MRGIIVRMIIFELFYSTCSEDCLDIFYRLAPFWTILSFDWYILCLAILILFILVKRTSWISGFINLLSQMKTNNIRTSVLDSIIFFISKFLGDISSLVFLFSILLVQRRLFLIKPLVFCRCPNSYLLLLWLSIQMIIDL